MRGGDEEEEEEETRNERERTRSKRRGRRRARLRELLREHGVHDGRVAREAVEHAADRCDVEERDGRAQHARERGVVDAERADGAVLGLVGGSNRR